MTDNNEESITLEVHPAKHTVTHAVVVAKPISLEVQDDPTTTGEQEEE